VRRRMMGNLEISTKAKDEFYQSPRDLDSLPDRSHAHGRKWDTQGFSVREPPTRRITANLSIAEISAAHTLLGSSRMMNRHAYIARIRPRAAR